MRQTPLTLAEWLREDPKRSVTLCYSSSDDCVAAFANSRRNSWEFEKQGEGIEDALESLTFAISTNDRKKKCLPKPVARYLTPQPSNMRMFLSWVFLAVSILVLNEPKDSR